MVRHADTASIPDFHGRLDALKAGNLYRHCRTISGSQGPEVILDGRRVILMCSNNYLGLADHPAIVEAAAKAAVEFGVGSGASRLISGTMDLHHELETQLAHFKGSERCLLFNSGYHANVGVISSVADTGDVIYSDELNHASIIDGARLSRAKVKIYPHLDMDALDEMMRSETLTGRKLIVTDAVFSMDGDIAPLDKLIELKHRYNAMLILDEAHATGVVGPGGRGLAAKFNIESDVDVSVGTLGKALGSFGAFVVGRDEIIEWLINTARSFIFTTALPPPVIAASLAALDIIEHEPERVETLKRSAAYMRRKLNEAGLKVSEGEIPIIPLVVGDADPTLKYADELLDEGIFCQAIRPPSVPDHACRLRITLMATHSMDHIDKAASAIIALAKKYVTVG